MTANQLRESFLSFFESKGHLRLPSSSLLPDNDPSVLLTTAGMQQFKPYFLGDKNAQAELGSSRVTTVQKCFRTSDIDEVGDATHLTFFEMLGNFSFGDYSKSEAIAWAWEYLTDILKLPESRLWVTIFAGDQRCGKDAEAEALWRKFVPADRIIALPAKSNFWGPPGETGPCGPCTEIFWQTNLESKGNPGTAEQDFVEIWNLVFMEYFQDAEKKLSPLPKKNVDTGMGLDRMLSIINNKTSLYDVGVFLTIKESLLKDTLFGLTGIPTDDERRTRIVSDHLRGAIFLLTDGVTFSNKDQGYILRRIIRRAADQYLVGSINFNSIIDIVIKEYSGTYLELVTNKVRIEAKIKSEIDQYYKTLKYDVETITKMRKQWEGMESLTNTVSEHFNNDSHRKLSSDEAFRLITTHGVSATRLAVLGYDFDRIGLNRKMDEHKEKSRAGAEKKFGGHGLFGPDVEAKFTPEQIQHMTRLHTATHLLQAALRAILGPDVKQSGSDISTERFRFDFTFPRKLTDEEKAKVEKLVNEKIDEDLPVSWTMTPFKQAIEDGALAFFKEKYPAEVKVYTVGDFSKELCGGPHVEHTGQIGHFKIMGEQSVGSGLRRIKAIVQ